MPSRRTVAGFVVAVVIVGGVLVSPGRALSIARRAAADPLAFAALVVALYAVRPVLAWPVTPLAVVVGYGFGLVGLPLALVGAGLTALPTFAAARWFGDGWDLSRVRSGTGRYFDATGEFRGVVVARLVPIPSDVVTCAAAVSGVSAWALFAGTVVGEIPWTVAAVVVGSSAETLTTSGLGGMELPLVAATLGAAAVLLAGPAYSLVRARR